MNKEMSGNTKAMFSLYKAGITRSESQRPCKHGTILDVLEWMNTPRLIHLTEQLRSISDEKEQKQFKTDRLPFVTFSGTFSYRNEQGLLQHSGLICFDVDHLSSDEEVSRVKSLLRSDSHFSTELLFTSPRGKGVKWVIRIDLSRATHEEWYRAIANYLLYTYNIKVDPAPKSVASACFLCHDPEVESNLMEEDNTEGLRTFDLERYLNREQPSQASIHPITYSAEDHDIYGQVVALTDEAEHRGIDLTQGYNNWLKVGFALSNGLGEEGRALFHRLSKLNPGYSPTECDRKYTSCLNGKGSGITISSLFHLAKEAGIDISTLTRDESANNAKVLSDTNSHKEVKINENAHKVSDGTMTQVAQCTFSDKIRREDLPSFLHPVIDNQSTAVGRDKMLLGVLNVVSGILPSSIYGVYDRRTVFPQLYNIIWGGYATSKGELEVAKQLVAPIKKEHREMFDAQLARYEEEMAIWEATDKKERGPKPQRPSLCSPFVAANSSASAVYRTLDANNGWGIIFDTEADTLTNMLSKSEYGDFSDLLRKAHHHETISMMRVGDNINIEIDSPRLAVMLTCTGSQLPLLLPPNNVANGLASRFLFYGLPENKVEFHDVFAGRENPIEDVYKDMGLKLMPLYHQLLMRADEPIQFVMSDAQQKEFLVTFNAVLQEQFSMLGNGIQGFIYRLALECFRYAMVLSVLRRLSEREAGEMLFYDNERALTCDDRDYRTALAIVNCLVNHTGRVYSVICSTNNDPFSKALQAPSPDIRRFYEALPDSGEFKTAVALSVAKRLNIPERSAKRMLGDMLTKYFVLSHPSHGIYAKASPTNGEDTDSATQSGTSAPLNTIVSNHKQHTYEDHR